MAMKNITYEIPKDNRGVFFSPALDRIPGLILENRRKFQSYKLEINGIPIRLLRERTRMAALHQAVRYMNGIKSLLRNDKSGAHRYERNNTQGTESWRITQDALCINEQTLDYETVKNIPIVQMGHEPVLYHPGVWIKNHLTGHLAKELGGIGFNMIVDNDGCNMGFMYAPILLEKSASVGKIPFVKDNEHVAYEEIVFDNFETMLRFKDDVLNLLAKNVRREEEHTIAEDMRDSFAQFTNRVGECYRQGCCDMVGLFTAARRSLEEEFGIDNLEAPVSWMCETDGFYHFLLHILCNAARFVNIYNEKLAEYRRMHQIRSKANPLPDLEIMNNVVELPFWVWKAGGQRMRCYLVNEGEDIRITDGADTLSVLRKNEDAMKNISRLKSLKNAGIKVRPRAITTTMFSRMFFSDVFIHGIGGAKYDTVTDEIIKDFFCIDPPGFVTISATLFLPLATNNLDEMSLDKLQHVINDIRFNPERYASKGTQDHPEFRNYVAEKQRVLQMMATAGSGEKRRYFDRIKDLNKLLSALISAEREGIQKEIRTIQEKLTYNEVVRFREYPVCLYPMKALKEYFQSVFS